MLVAPVEKTPSSAVDNAKSKAAEQPQQTSSVPEVGDVLLNHAIAGLKIGGVVTLGDTTQLTVDAQLHKEGDVFTTKVQGRLVLIRIKLLSTSSVTLALDDPNQGTAEKRVRLK